MKSKITGVILAGGNAKRMGGIDKGLVDVLGRELISYTYDCIRHQVSNLMINANRNINEYKKYNVEIIPDQTTERLGPLAGIQSGLVNCKTEYLLSVPCDVPNLPKNLCEILYKDLIKNNSDCVMPYTINNNKTKRTHPVILLLKSKFADSLNEFIKNGGRKIDSWTKTLNTSEVFFYDENSFLNINKLEDIEKIFK